MYIFHEDDDDSLLPKRLCLVNKDFKTPFSCSMTRILKKKDERLQFEFKKSISTNSIS